MEKRRWVMHYRWARGRCMHKSNTSYYLYGAKGIKMLMTQDEVHRIWTRDKAERMDRPSIDRINPDGHYELKNCRFLEFLDNCARKRKYVIKDELLGIGNRHYRFYWRKRRDKICIHCYEPVEEGKTFCKKHLAWSRNYARKRYQHLRSRAGIGE